MTHNNESKNARFLGLCAVATFILACILAGCNDNVNTCNVTENCAEAIVWSIPDASWEYCDMQLEQSPVADNVANSIIEYIPNIDVVGSDFEVVCYYFAHQYECQLVEAQILTY